MADPIPDPSRIKQEFVQQFGAWGPGWQSMLDRMPDFLKAYGDFVAAARKSRHLEPKVQEFLLIATSAATTQLHEPAIRHHIANALKCGATRDEIGEVLQLTSVLGIHSCAIGVPLLIAEARERGLGEDIEKAMNDPYRQKLKAEFIEKRGFWTDFWEGVLSLSPDFFTSYLRMSSLPWATGALSPKVKEFIYIAINAATTHLYVDGLAVHIRNCFNHGATVDEIMEVLEIISTIGVYSCTVGLPILEELSREDAARAP